MNFLRSLLSLPLGLAFALFASGLILWLGDALVGRWAVLSGIVVYAGGGNLPVLSLGIGLAVAPRPSRRAKWLLLAPHIAFGALLCLPTLAALLFTDAAAAPPGERMLSRSLSWPWQLGLWNAGYLMGVFFAASRSVEELAETPEAAEASKIVWNVGPLQTARIFRDETRYSKLGGRAFELHAEGRIPEAIHAFERALKLVERLRPLNPDAYAHPLGQFHRRLADCKAEIDDLAKALEHFERSVDFLRQADAAQPGLCTVELAETLVNQGANLTEVGAYDRAQAALEGARGLFHDLDERRPGSHAGDVVRAEGHLANLLCKRGQVEEGRRALEQTLERFRALDREHPGTVAVDVVYTLLSLGAAYGELGDVERARAVLEEALQNPASQEHGVGGPAHFKALINLGNAQRRAGRLHDARATFEDVLRELEALEAARPGAFALASVQARDSLASVLGDLGHFRQALAVREANVALLERLDAGQGEVYSKELATAEINLGSTFAESGEYEKARRVLERSVARLRRLDQTQPGAFASPLAQALTNSGLVASSMGRFEAAEVLLTEAIEILLPLGREQPALHTPHLAIAYSNLGGLYRKTGRLAQARERYEAARRLLEDLDGEPTGRFFHHLEFLYGNLGTAYSDLGELDRGSELYEESLARLRSFEEREPGAYAAKIAHTLANLGANDWDRRAYRRAAERFREAYEIFEKLEQAQPGVYLPYLARDYARWAGSTLEAVGGEDNPEAAAAYLAAEERVVALYERLESEHPGSYTRSLAIWLSNLGSTRVRRGEPERGAEELQRALELFERLEQGSPGVLHAEWARAHEYLGRIDRDQGRRQEAYRHWHRALTFLETKRGLVASRTGRALQQRNFAALYRQMVRLCLELGRPVEAWHFAERGKAREVLDLLANARPNLSSEEDRNLFERWKAAEQEAIRFLERIENPGERMMPQWQRREFPKLYDSGRNEEEAQRVFAREARVRRELQERVAALWLPAEVPPPEELARSLQELVEGRRVLLLQWVSLFTRQPRASRPRNGSPSSRSPSTRFSTAEISRAGRLSTPPCTTPL